MAPLVSVIIPTYNRAHLLGRAIESVLDQSFRDFDLWIIDDGSTDETPQLVQSFSQLNKLKSSSQKLPTLYYEKIDSQGVSAARNYGIKKSTGQWVAFLDSDDEWLPQKLAKQWQLISQSPEQNIVHTDEVWIRNGVRINPMKKHQKGGGRIYSRSIELCCISPSTVLIRRSALDQVGLFRDDFPACEDYELWLRLTAQYEVGYIDEPLIKKYGGHPDQLSRKYVAMDYWRAKALKGMLHNPFLTAQEKQDTAFSILKRCEILLNGYKKYGNFHHFTEISEIKDETLRILTTDKSLLLCSKNGLSYFVRTDDEASPFQH